RSRAGGPQAQLPSPGNEPRGEHDGLEGERCRAGRPRDRPQGRAGEDPRASAERRVTASEAQPLSLPRGFKPRGFPLVLSGPSGVGKTSVVSHLLSRGGDIVFSVSATTRPRREGESDGREYLFYAEVRFRRGVESGEFVEHASVQGRWYGTPRAPLEAALARGQIVILDVDVQGGRSPGTPARTACSSSSIRLRWKCWRRACA